MNATVAVTAVDRVGPETVALELETPDGFDAAPGQFVLVRATPDDEEIARHYTLSSPTMDETFEITVGVDPEGDLSPWLADREPGDEIEIEGPFGEIAYERDSHVVAIAGGPGVGPAVAIAEAAQDSDYDAAVVYLDDEPAHMDRLDALSADDVPVTIVADGDEERLRGAIADHVTDGQLFAFGFTEFVTTVADAIEDAGGDPDDALIENFG
ncbi:flavodoxin reductase family protein [Halovivax ruber XH-70]|uniref:Flavodoxin reductase family protein n=1 Tax=Halovivax ruber (strain DSM 18193 / JCM 13892 / XH-70) TaxID=797302 RepID=L0IC59_HALRX|nr:FAD-binding oxidoreductase [Halovivax ruber]AGB16408.1 flavodoxin reductase family protein [Halovivax ruber XH-70]